MKSNMGGGNMKICTQKNQMSENICEIRWGLARNVIDFWLTDLSREIALIVIMRMPEEINVMLVASAMWVNVGTRVATLVLKRIKISKF